MSKERGKSRFQSLLKQGPDLGMDDDLIAQTYYMSLGITSRMHLDGSAGGSLLDLTAKAGMKLLTKIARTEDMYRHWDEFEDSSPPQKLARIEEIPSDSGKRQVSEVALMEYAKDLVREEPKRGGADWHTRGADRHPGADWHNTGVDRHQFE